MSDVGWFLPILIIVCVAFSILIAHLDEFDKGKDPYELWLMKELKRNPNYIRYLKNCGGRNYKLGRKVLRDMDE